MLIAWCSPFLIIFLFAVPLISLLFSCYYRYKSGFSLNRTKQIQNQRLIWFGIFAISMLFNLAAQSACAITNSSLVQKSIEDAVEILDEYKPHLAELRQLNYLERLNSLDHLSELHQLKKLESIELLVADGFSKITSELSSLGHLVELRELRELRELESLRDSIDIGMNDQLQRLSHLDQLEQLKYLSNLSTQENKITNVDLISGKEEIIEFPAGYPKDGNCMCPGEVHCAQYIDCLLYTSPSPRDATLSRMPSSA